MQRALNIYQMELSRLHQRAIAAAAGNTDSGDGQNSEPAVSPVPKSVDENSRDKDDDAGSDNDDKKSSSVFPSGIAFPATGDLPKFPVTSSLNTSPLQQIASITNSLNVNPSSVPNLPFQRPGSNQLGQQRPYKNILPPIHQAQLDRYDSINTEEVVRQVQMHFCLVANQFKRTHSRSRRCCQVIQ